MFKFNAFYKATPEPHDASDMCDESDVLGSVFQLASCEPPEGATGPKPPLVCNCYSTCGPTKTAGHRGRATVEQKRSSFTVDLGKTARKHAQSCEAAGMEMRVHNEEGPLGGTFWPLNGCLVDIAS